MKEEQIEINDIQVKYPNHFLSEYLVDENCNIIAAMFSDGLRPIPRMTVSEWSDKYRILTSASSAEFGKFRTMRVPYIRKIADNLGKTSDVWKTIVMKGAQLGLTELGNNWIGYVMHLNPGPVIMIMPTEAAVKKNSRTRIKPMVESTPVLRDKLNAPGSKEGGNTVSEKEFPGGVLIMIGANSPVGLSSTPAGNIFLDEVDRYPKSAGDEGSPIDLAEARASTFSNKKIFIISTPTNEGESVIAKEFLEGDQQYYNVPCQGCGDLFILKFEYLTWDEGKPETTKMACPNCGFCHEERHKTKMLPEKGYGGHAEWIPTAVASDPLIESFHISGLYSPAGWLSWVQVVRKWLKIKGDTNKEKTFNNTVLALTFKIKGESPDCETLYNRRESYALGVIPKGVCLLTMGVDIQKDRIELEVVGWGIGLESWSVDYKTLVGDTSLNEVWQELRDVINSHYYFEDGSAMHINMTCIDAGFNTKKVYDFTSKFSYNRVKPIMGRDSVKDVMVSPPKLINLAKTGKKISGAKVWYLGVSMLKDELYGFLKLKVSEVEGVKTFPNGYCHFPEYDLNYFKMLTAEELQLTKNKKGYDVWTWVKTFERNEALDVRNYARAAAYIVGVDRFKKENWDKIKTQIRPPDKTEETVISKPKPKKSSFWDRER